MVSWLGRHAAIARACQQAFPAGGAKPAGSESCRRTAPSGLAGDITCIATGEGWALPGRDPRSVHPQGGPLGHGDHTRAESTSATLTMVIQRRRPGAGLISRERASSIVPTAVVSMPPAPTTGISWRRPRYPIDEP